jgi:hypothetical protein
VEILGVLITEVDDEIGGSDAHLAGIAPSRINSTAIIDLYVCLKELTQTMIHDPDPCQGLKVIPDDPHRSLFPLSLHGNIPLVLVSQPSNDSVKRQVTFSERNLTRSQDQRFPKFNSQRYVMMPA